MSLADHDRFAMQVTQISKALRSEMDKRLAGLGLSQARWLVLLHLARFKNAPTQRELAQSMGIEGPTLARLLDNLESQELLYRQASNKDKRVKKIVLSGRSNYLIKEIETIAKRLRHELLNDVDPEDLYRCNKVHTQIMNNLEKSHAKP